MLSDINGDGTLDALISAIGTMAADLTVTGSTLTTANVGAAVWEELDALHIDPETKGGVVRTKRV
jgi:hypothetical protein